MSLKTPCVLIEAGVGYRTPEDHNTLWFQQGRVIKGITDGIKNALGTQTPEPPVDPCKQYKDEIIVIQKQLDVALQKNGELSDQVEKLQKQIDEHECPITSEPEPSDQIETGSKIRKDGNGNIIWAEKTYKPV